MVNEYYRFIDAENYTVFYFASEGTQGTVLKVVLFTLGEDNRWNLGFGDLRNGEIDDSIITNNHDIVKVMGTIAKIVYLFFEKYPDATIAIRPVDEKRKRLYNSIFQRHLSEMKLVFEIIGFVGEESEVYSIGKNYDIFEIKLK